MRGWAKVVLPVLVLAGAGVAARVILGGSPEPDRRPPRANVPVVEATRLVPTSYPVLVGARGTVRPTQANTLVSEVTGAVTALADAFVAGGAFERGELLVQLDRRDYAIALTRARAELARAEAQLEEQLALAEQARLEWRQLGRRGEPSALTLREPQLAAARAERDAAAAEIERAELDLERTRIVAPYDGQVLERAVDPGQFVNRGATIGRIHAIDSFEVALPLGSRQLAYLDLPPPDAVRRAAAVPDDLPVVELEARAATGTHRWGGRLVRVEGIDPATQQLYVVARIDAPYADPAAPLRVGQYVEASIAGRVLEDVFVVPRRALREEGEVLVVDEAGELYRRAVEIAWSDESVAAVIGGLEEGEILVLTPLSTVVDGTPVRAIIDGRDPASPEPRRDVRERALGDG